MERFLSFLCGYTLAAFIAVGVSIWSGECEAAELTQHQARSIYTVAYGQYTGPPEWLEKMPTVHVVDTGIICLLFSKKPDCGVLGAYVEGRVYMDNTLDFATPLAASILLHEFIHHFQQLKHGQQVKEAMAAGNTNLACRTWLAREAEAYAIQADVLDGMNEDVLARQARHLSQQMAGAQRRCPPTVAI